MFTTAKSLMTIGAGATRLLMDVCFPPHCASCDAPVDSQGNLCTICFTGLQQISAPQCECCGMPFSLALDAGLCAACLTEKPHYDSARAVWVYNQVSSRLVTRLKFSDHSTSLSHYGRLMSYAAAKTTQDGEIIIPVPLHWRRLMLRRYNQSALLAYALADEMKLPVAARAIKRIRATRPQTSLKGDARRKNVKNAFVADATSVGGKSVILVDDVMTTGATIMACTQALIAAGAKAVHVVTLARTGKE